jgi:hypothetical protein
MRTTVAISDPLLKGAKRKAAERGITLSELVEEGLAMVLSATKNAKTDKPFVLKTERGVLVDPSIDLDRTSALIVADDEEYSRRHK